ncbi:serine/threonine protein kinase [Nannocystis exedens]|uniref:Serine/threonine protein kinase n=1 Tax=Nannocystis exedens TaxID=54 RepID=A0A1I1YDF6_9BACT|nr:serine/threonine-protein kinase [Nannocystis exedens]PCC71904.1 serine/threonine protein kinase [Nannocystis exedens]SFE16123.1 serine/threonine protein kinase [Nannocystis exedens]
MEAAVGNQATLAWSRMETQFPAELASTMAGTSAASRITRIDPNRRSLSVLPQIETDVSGQVRLVHDPRDRYRSLGVVGEGGMGVVERAEDVDIGRPVAIKRLLPEASHPLGVARFVGEVRIVGALEHPNVVPIHDVGLDAEGRYFFVMKYVEGQTLGEVIDKLRRGDPETHLQWPFERRAEIVISVLRALAYAHERGIVHRDIKPDNIMIGRFGEVWLMDWGIAKKMDEPDPGVPTERGEDRTAGLIGTPAYMSPEQVRCEPLDARSDLYSVAVVLHEFIGLNHYLHHRTDNLAVLLDAIENEHPVLRGPGAYDSPHQGPPPIELQIVAARGLAKDPAHRYQSAAEMLAGVRGYLEGRGEVRCMYSFTKRAMRESGRVIDRYPRLGVAMYFGLIVLALVGLAALFKLLLG